MSDTNTMTIPGRVKYISLTKENAKGERFLQLKGEWDDERDPEKQLGPIEWLDLLNTARVIAPDGTWPDGNTKYSVTGGSQPLTIVKTFHGKGNPPTKELVIPNGTPPSPPRPSSQPTEAEVTRDPIKETGGTSPRGGPSDGSYADADLRNRIKQTEVAGLLGLEMACHHFEQIQMKWAVPFTSADVQHQATGYAIQLTRALDSRDKPAPLLTRKVLEWYREHHKPMDPKNLASYQDKPQAIQDEEGDLPF